MKPTQKKSKIWQLLRNRKDIYSLDNPDSLILNGGMSEMGIGLPYSYMCNVFGFEITFYSRSKLCTVFKSKYENNRPNLHYHYFISDDDFPLFKSELREKIDQETLSKLANRDWTKYDRFIQTEANTLFMKYMKYKYIKYMEYHKQIIFDKNKNKYVSYDFYSTWENKNENKA